MALQLKSNRGPVKDILIVRHGATRLNNQTDVSADRIRGHENIPLDEEGIADAHRAAAELLHFNIEIVVASDLSRAGDTGEIIATTNHCPVYKTPLLRPWNLGYLQGKSTKEALPIIAKFACDAPDQAVPGGGESFRDFAARAMRGLEYAIKIAGDKTLCIVTHHRDERLFNAWKDAGYPPDRTIHIETFLQKGEPPGAVMPFEVPLHALFATENIQ